MYLRCLEPVNMTKYQATDECYIYGYYISKRWDQPEAICKKAKVGFCQLQALISNLFYTNIYYIYLYIDSVCRKQEFPLQLRENLNIDIHLKQNLREYSENPQLLYSTICYTVGNRTV
jgi:hypothetical protein